MMIGRLLDIASELQEVSDKIALFVEELRIMSEAAGNEELSDNLEILANNLDHELIKIEAIGGFDDHDYDFLSK